MHNSLFLAAVGFLVHSPVAGYAIAARVDHGNQQRVLSDVSARHGHPPGHISPQSHHPSDLQTGFVALGDSYSAGIGTGVSGKEDDCRHGNGAYPQLIAADLARSQPGGTPNITSAQLLACTGATTAQILPGVEDSQIDRFDTTRPADFALLSLGGNDLGFFDVMNSCVFRFYSFYSGTCESALARAAREIESDDFAVRLGVAVTEILDRARWEKKPWFLITMTGYARFFDAETEACDDMSLGVWWNGPKLTRELRASMNALVLAVNGKIRETVAGINRRFATRKVVFVDYDDLFEGHRFCEQGVSEPDYERDDTWFFLVGGRDNARNETGNSTGSHHAAGGGHHSAGTTTLPTDLAALVDPSACLEPARRSGDWGAQALCYMAMARRRDPALRLAPALPGRVGAPPPLPLGSQPRGDQEVSVQNSMWYVPTYYGKTFHPRSRGHEAIRDAVYRAWRRLDDDDDDDNDE
ncbi:SGNH hydrolase-type esterase domain-containing protein [Microdochium bolleyi]|uniref:SGNH hydrolase-type esterase domain-containing protein n=1 Tax=Microdochium bolleyi TaxID=196109 RepID=A0A136JKK1_9PEZI|nr:SGNH hydrolase-type esterase domain-containing protein [Microdochium bolleyi]